MLQSIKKKSEVSAPSARSGSLHMADQLKDFRRPKTIQESQLCLLFDATVEIKMCSDGWSNRRATF
jgi:hypothetical protein